jgi:hypothetical protein
VAEFSTQVDELCDGFRIPSWRRPLVAALLFGARLNLQFAQQAAKKGARTHVRDRFTELAAALDALHRALRPEPASFHRFLSLAAGDTVAGFMTATGLQLLERFDRRRYEVDAELPRRMRIYLDEYGISEVIRRELIARLREDVRTAVERGLLPPPSSSQSMRNLVLRTVLDAYKVGTNKQAVASANSDTVAFTEAALEILGVDAVGVATAISRELHQRSRRASSISSRAPRKKTSR